MKILQVVLLLSIVYISSCRTQDLIPDAHPDAKIYATVINTTNAGDNAGSIVVDSVKAGTEVVKLRINVTGSPTAAQYIYIVYATDNGAFLPLPVPTTINDFGTFEGGNSSTYSLKVPALSTFTIDVFVSVRNTAAATNDVYKIWITDSIGSFARPTYKRISGISTINLRYKTTSLNDTYTFNTLFAGSQSSRNYGSFIATGTQIIAMDSTAYVQSPKSADIAIVTLNSGKKDNNSASLWLYSPADILQANPAVSGQTDFVLPPLPTPQIPNTTSFGVYSGTTLFDSVKTAELLALPNPTSKSIQGSTGGVYIFKTEAGKKGLIRVNSTAVATTIGGVGSTTGQNASVSVRILN